MQLYIYSDHNNSEPRDADDARYVKAHQTRNSGSRAFIRDGSFPIERLVADFVPNLDLTSDRDAFLRVVSAAACGSVDSVFLGDNDNYLISPIDLGRRKILSNATVYRTLDAYREEELYGAYRGTPIEAALEGRPLGFVVTPDGEGFRYTLVSDAPGAHATLPARLGTRSVYETLAYMAENDILTKEIAAILGDDWKDMLVASRTAGPAPR